jgi:hypothetical protein
MKRLYSLVLLLSAFAISAMGQKVEVQWDKTERISRTTPTLQVVVNPPLRAGSPIRERAYAEVQRLGADYVRYVPWLPYPKLGVAELEPPTKEKTSWDFTLIDPMTIDFLNATKGHPVILNFSTIPAWMFKTEKRVEYPQDPEQVTWDYTQGTELRDPTGKELGDYYARLVSWYVNGGFTDELGKGHESGHHFKIDYWEVLNEPDIEHSTTPEQYTQRYDAIVSAIRKVAPNMKFVGISVAWPSQAPHMFEYFLNPKNHKPGIPLDMISYHFYASPTEDQGPEIQQYTFFDQADRFLATAAYIEEIRKRYSPSTRTTVNEIGSILAGEPKSDGRITESYWNLSGAMYAYIFGQLATQGIDIAGESQLVGYPTQFPSVSMVDWNTGGPNARFRVLELLKNHFGPDDKIVKTTSDTPYGYALAVMKPKGERKLLLVSKRDRDLDVTLPSAAEQVQYVDQTTRGGEIGRKPLDGNKLTLRGLSVAVVTLKAS